MPGPEGWATPAAVRSEPDPVAAVQAAGPDEAGRANGARETRLDRAELLGGDVPFRPLGIAEILDGAIASIRHNPRGVLGVSVALTSVIQVLNTIAAFYFISGASEDDAAATLAERSVGIQFMLGLISLVMSAYGTLLLAGLFGPVLARMLFGLPGSMREAWRESRPQVPRLLVVAAVVTTLSLAGAMLPLIPLVLLLAGDGPPELGVLAGLVGFPASLVLAVWLYVLLVLAVPAVIFERQGIIGALRRARQLSRGRWWRTFGTLLLTLLITILGFIALGIPFRIVDLIFFGSDPGGGALIGALSVDTFGRIVSWSLITPFEAGVLILLYIDHRMRREGFDLEMQTRADADRVPGDFLELWRPSPLVPPPGTPPLSAPAQPRGYPPLMGPGAPPGHPSPGYPQPGYPPPGRPPPGYSTPPGYPPPPGYSPPGYPPQHGQPTGPGQPAGPGYPAGAGYPAQPGYPSQQLPYAQGSSDPPQPPYTRAPGQAS